MTIPDPTVDQPAAGAPDSHDDFGGLGRDLPAFLGRRRALRLLGGAGLAGLLAACGSSGGGDAATTTAGSAPATGGSGSSGTGSSGTGSSGTASSGTASSGTGSSGTGSTAAGAGEEIADETPGPFPADGSNGPNLLTDSDIVRSDITGSIAGLSGTAEGVPATVQLTIVDAATGNAVPGAAVYAWHCDAAGAYSLYEVTDQNYLRGVQAADAAGHLTFESVFPGCYRGRWPHIHFEVFDSLESATAGAASVKTSQLALPEAECRSVYADSRYGASAANLSPQSLAGDGIFADGWESQLATVAGSNDDGYTISLLVRI